jgi:cytidine deaminase
MAKRAERQPRKIDWPTLVKAAREARKHAYAPYSKFQVGAAILGESGRVYQGCNVENSSYGLSMCAERNAAGAAILGGERRIVAIAIAGGSDKPCPPCGACRQVLAELGGPEVAVALVGGRTRTVHQLGDLLPFIFDKSFL